MRRVTNAVAFSAAAALLAACAPEELEGPFPERTDLLAPGALQTVSGGPETGPVVCREPGDTLEEDEGDPETTRQREPGTPTAGIVLNAPTRFVARTVLTQDSYLVVEGCTVGSAPDPLPDPPAMAAVAVTVDGRLLGTMPIFLDLRPAWRRVISIPYPPFRSREIGLSARIAEGRAMGITTLAVVRGEAPPGASVEVDPENRVDPEGFGVRLPRLEETDDEMWEGYGETYSQDDGS